jgi:hypothetical protein
MEDKIIIIDNKIFCTQEEWDKITNYKGGLELTKSLMSSHYCEASGEKCDKICNYCKNEK